jgi:hypothetical protein
MTRPPCAFVFAATLFLPTQPLSASEPLPDETLFLSLAARNPQEVESTDELWSLVGQCQEELKARTTEEYDERVAALSVRCEAYAQAVAERADGSARDRVFDRLESLEGDDRLGPALLAGLLAGRIAEAVRELPPATAPPPLPLPLTDVPATLAAASPELQRAWQTHEALVRAYRDLQEHLRGNGEDGISFHEARGEFQASIVDFLRGRLPAEEALRKITRFEWGGMCGMGSEVLHVPQTRTMLLALLAMGDRSAAAGALATVGRMREPNSALGEGWDRDLLTRLGFDWEQVYLGRVLDGWTHEAAPLARHGSASSARLLFDAHALRPNEDGEPLEDDETYLHALAALVTPTDYCSSYSTGSSLDVRRESEGPVGTDVEEGVLRLLAQKVGRGAGLGEAETAGHLLVRACRTENLPAFRQMARSPYAKVRDAGALALRSLGERPPPSRSNPPVSVRVSVAGAALEGSTLTWSLSRSRDDEYSSRQSSSAVVEAGLLRIERDPFLDPKEQVDTVSVATTDMKDPADLWFSVSTPRPRRLDQILDLQVETQALTLICPQVEGSPARITLLGNQAMWGSDMMLPILSEVPIAPGQDRVTFPRLQRGRYQVMVVAKDGFWQSEELTLARRPRTMTCGPLRSMEAELMEIALRSNP